METHSTAAETQRSKQFARILLVIAVAVISYLFLVRGEETPNIDEQSFPSGDSGLGDAEVTEGNAPRSEKSSEGSAQAPETPAPSSTPEQPSDLSAVGSHAEPDAATVKQEILGSRARAASEPAEEVKEAPTSTKEPLASAEDLGPLERVSSSTAPFRLQLSQQGDSLIGDSRSIISLQADGGVKTLLSKKIFDGEFNEDLPELSALHRRGDVAYVGAGNGLFLAYERYEWKALSRPRDPIASRINAIVATDKSVFIGARGLYKYDNNLKRVLAHPSFRDQTVSSFLVTANGQLFLGSRSGLWRYNADSEDSWSQVWKLTPRDFDIYTLAENSDGSLWIGTNNGLQRLSSKGQITERHLSGQRVLSIANGADNTLWVGTMKDGLRYFDGEQWYTLGKKHGFDKRIEDVSLDSAGRIWVAVLGKGVYRAAVDEAIRHIKSFPDTLIDINAPKQYSDFCAAVSAELPGIDRSRDIAVETFEGEKLYFLGGVQECPSGIGYLRTDGALAVLRGSEIIYSIGGERKALALPKDFPADKVKTLLLDSKSRLWLGTDGMGLLVYAGDTWNTLAEAQGLRDNPITSIIEDEAGNVWIGSTPPYDQENKTYHLKNLHLSNDKGWFQYDSRSGLIHVGTHSLALKKDGTLVIGTHAGLSLLAKNGFVTNIGQEQGVRPNFAFHVSVDAKDRIWISHQYFGDGISWFDGNALYRFSLATGLFNNRIIKTAHDRTRRVWVIASNGRVGVYPIEFLETHKSTVRIEEDKIRSVNMFQRE